MKGIFISIFLIVLCVVSVQNGAIDSKDFSQKKSLYDSNDKIEVLSKANFKSIIFHQNYAWLVEFYNSWCGFCQKYAPKFKEFAADVSNWKSIVRIAAIDCADDANNDICREYEVMVYPSLRYFHENYSEGPQLFGEYIRKGHNAIEIKENLLGMLQNEQLSGRGKDWPLLTSQNYESKTSAWTHMPSNVNVIFLIFDAANSTIGAQVILDLNIVFGIAIRTVSNNSGLARELNIQHYPSLQVMSKDLTVTPLTPKSPSRFSFRKAILSYLKTKNYNVPQDIEQETSLSNSIMSPVHNNSIFNTASKFKEIGDIVYQTDLETGLRYTLSHEITKMKYITGDALVALRNYLQVIVKYFPFTANGKVYLTELHARVQEDSDNWTGARFSSLIEELEGTYAPVYSTLPGWVGCRGSAPHFRGFTCSLWIIFHVLTVNAAVKKTPDSLEVLSAMHGYVKYFFGCTDCSQHFQTMARENKLFSVAENDAAILWLWIAHNEVNHRLAGDDTEDPQHPKRQFPTAENCPKCWHETWVISEVLNYLKRIYGVGEINFSGAIPHPSPSPFTSFDMVLLVSLYIFFVFMLLVILRWFLKKRCYRKKSYKQYTLGKV